MKPGISVGSALDLAAKSLTRVPVVEVYCSNERLDFSYRLPGGSPFADNDAPLAQHKYLYGGTTERILRAAYHSTNGLMYSKITSGADAQWIAWTALTTSITECLPCVVGSTDTLRIFYHASDGYIKYYGSTDGWDTNSGPTTVAAVPSGLSNIASGSDDVNVVYIAGFDTDHITVLRSVYTTSWSAFETVQQFWVSEDWDRLFFVANSLAMIQPVTWGPIYRMWLDDDITYPDAIAVLNRDVALDEWGIRLTSLEYSSNWWVGVGVPLSTTSYSGMCMRLESPDGEHWSMARNDVVTTTMLFGGYQELGSYAFYSGLLNTYRATLPVATDMTDHFISGNVDLPLGGLGQGTVVLGNGDGALNDHSDLVNNTKLEIIAGYNDGTDRTETLFTGCADSVSFDARQMTVRVQALDGGR